MTRQNLKPDEIDFEKAHNWANFWLGCRVEHASRNMARAYLALEARLANERAKLAIAIRTMKFIAEDCDLGDARSRPAIWDALRRIAELEKQ